MPVGKRGAIALRSVQITRRRRVAAAIGPSASRLRRTRAIAIACTAFSAERVGSAGSLQQCRAG